MEKQLFIYMMMALLPLVSFSQNEPVTNSTDNRGQKQGRWIEKTGEIEVAGYYIDNLKDGNWTAHSLENSMLLRVETYKMGRKNGLFLEMSKRGSLVSEQFFTSDIPDGPFRQYGQNGILASVNNYDMGKLHGPQIIYYENLQGKKSEEANYKSGVKDGPSQWFNTEGDLIADYNYVNGMLQGEQKSFYAGKKIRTSEFYVNNVQEGASLEYFENGNVKVSGQYKAGLKQGKWIDYDETGTILKTTVFVNGKEK